MKSHRLHLASFTMVAIITACAPPAPPPPANNGPTFVINAPLENSSLVGTVFFSVQPTDSSSVSNIQFKAGNQVLTPDPKNKFRAFVNTKDYPAGTLKLEASLTAVNGGIRTQSVKVQNIPNPPSSGTVGNAGVVLSATEKSGAVSSLTIAPGTADGANVTFATQTKEEVKTATGVDYDALGVTFLGAQNITSSKTLTGPLGVTSGGFGPQVQPGQAVVQYSIAPDADGDGKGELVVVNTASVTPSGDVISDPVPQVLLGQTEITAASRVHTIRDPRAEPITGSPGTRVQIKATGFNMLSLQGTRAIYRSSVNNLEVNSFAVVQPDLENTSQQIVSTHIPTLPVGGATLQFQNLSSGFLSPALNIMVIASRPLTKAPEVVIDEMLVKIKSNLTTWATQDSSLGFALTELERLRSLFKEISQTPSASETQALNDVAIILSNAGLGSLLEQTSNLLEKSTTRACSTEGKRKLASGLIKTGVAAALGLVAAGLALAPEPTLLTKGAAVGLGGVAASLGASGLSDIADGIGICSNPDDPKPCDKASSNRQTCDLPPPPPPCVPSVGGGGAGMTGMGSAPPPGGNGCGNANPPSPTPSNVLLKQLAPINLAGRIVVKVFVNNSSTPFSGRTDASGYFFIPLIPQGQPFKAVAIDTVTGKRRTFDGTGPATGRWVYMFFNFADNTPEPEKIARWDGGGDGTTWNDARNWVGDVPPLDGDKVIIDIPGNANITYSFANGDTLLQSLECKESLIVTSGTLEISQDSNLESLEFRTGTLKGAGNLSVNTLRWASGTLEGNSSLTVNNTLELQNGAHFLNERRLVNKGAATFQDGTLYFQNNAIFRNDIGATLIDNHVGNQVSFSSSGTLGTSHFENAGTWTVAPTGDTNGNRDSYVYIPVRNTGTININAGQLWLQSEDNTAALEFDWAGTLNVADGASVKFVSGGTSLTGTLNGTGSAALEVQGGTVMLGTRVNYAVPNTRISGGTLIANSGSSTTFANLSLTNGTFSGMDSVSVGNMSWASGTLTGTGTTTVTSSFTMPNGSRFLNGTTLVNKGTATVQDGTMYFQNGAVFTNATGATYNDSHVGNQTLFSNSGSSVGNRIINAGILTFAPTADVNGNRDGYGYVFLTNTGTINIDTGRVWLQAEDNSANTDLELGGTINVAAGAQIKFAQGTANLTGTLNTTGTGLLEISGGTLQLSPGSSFAATNTNISGGTFTANSGASVLFPNLIFSNGTLNGTDNVAITNFNWASGTLGGTGTATVNASLNFNNGSRFLNARALVNKGTASLVDGTMYFQNGAVFTNDTGATLTDSHVGNQTLFSSSGSSVGNRIINNGTFTIAPVADVNGNRDGYSYVFFTNTGTLNINTGRLWLQAEDNTAATDLEFGGTVNIADGAFLRLAQGSANLSGTFAGAGTGTLEVTGGTANLSGSSYSIPNTNLTSGTFRANGTMTTNFSNAGMLEIAAGVGTLSINGNYLQTTSGRLNLELAATNNFDQLNVSGTVSLNGGLILDRLAGFEPALGASFAAITAGNLTGTFSSIQNTSIVTGRVFQAAYGSSNLNLNVVAP